MLVGLSRYCSASGMFATDSFHTSSAADEARAKQTGIVQLPNREVLKCISCVPDIVKKTFVTNQIMTISKRRS